MNAAQNCLTTRLALIRPVPANELHAVYHGPSWILFPVGKAVFGYSYHVTTVSTAYASKSTRYRTYSMVNQVSCCTGRHYETSTTPTDDVTDVIF